MITRSNPALGALLQRPGVSPVPGLYFLGVHWMHTITSSLLSGVGNDAEYLAKHVDVALGGVPA